MSDWWWTPSRDATLLALGLARQAPPPASTFDAITAKFAAFERTYLDLLELLKRDNKSIEVLDALTRPSLSQTLDEFEDFKFDADTLRRGVGSFSKRELGIPLLPYKVARYVYTDADIHQLEAKINWQIRIMDGKMDNMVLSYFVRVHRRSQVRPSHDDHDSGSLASTLRGSNNQRLAGLPHRQDDEDDDENDESIIRLWDRVDRLSNRLVRTSPHVQSQIDSNETPPRLSPEEISRVIEPLKARFKKTARSESARMFESITEDQLATYSENRLKTLLTSFPSFTTRRRVYSRDEITKPRNSLQAKKVQGHPFSPRSIATMEIIPPGMKINLMALDIVTFQRQTVIVCTDEHKKIGALHYLPPHSVIYPTTNTRRVDSSKHDTEVLFKEECLVQLTGSQSYSVPKALAMYNFPQTSDMLAFQCALRGKHIRHVFDVDKIESMRGLETTHQHLKIWSDYNDENYTLSFYVKMKTGHETDLEFPLECFVPNPTPSQDKNKPQMMRLYFRLQQLEPPKSKRSSRDSITNAPSPPGTMTTKGRLSFSRNRHNSAEISPTQSMFKMFGKNRRPSETALSLPPPTGRIDQRSSSSFGSLETESTDNTTAESVVSASPGLGPKIHPDAETMQYLDFKFSIITDTKLFTTGFMSAINNTIKHKHFRGNSIYDESRSRVTVLPSEPITVGKNTTSPRTTYLGSQVVQEFPELSLPPAMVTISRSDKELVISSGDESDAEDHSVSTQAFAFEDHQPATIDDPLKAEAITPDLVYRVRGIPINYQVDELKRFIASEFIITHSEIDVRSLATNPDGKSQTAIVVFENVPLAISSKDNNWSFRWKFVKGKNASHVQIDTHFYGLTMLYTPPRYAKHEIDICVVAVGGSAFEAFEEKERGGSYMWVLDLLQDYFASARIMLYGCHPNPSRSGSSMVIENLARELIDSMNDLDDDGESQASDSNYDTAGNVPLIFIGYSLAGQVIKQAMVLAAEQSEDDNFYKSVYGALFFGVPSSAMETSALETILKDQAGSFRDMSDQTKVQILNDKFNSVIERKDLHMQYFYETEGTIRLQKDSNYNQWKAVGDPILVVTPSSATNFLTSEQSTKSAKKVHSIQRDHLGLVKWGAHDPECPMVIRVMKTMKTKALAKQNGQRRTFPSPDLSGRSRFQPPARRPTGPPASPRMETGFQQSARTATGFASQRTTQSETARSAGVVSTKDYHVGWICAVGPEYVAALQLLDERLSRPFDLSEDDENAYSFGMIGDHHVVIAGLAQGKYGLTSAASAATDMQRSFRFIRIGLMVGIAGGAPSKKHDIRLGDVVVSTPRGQRGGVFRYDSGRTIQDREFVITGSLNSPPEFLLKALMKLYTLHRSDGHDIKLTVESMLQKNPRLRNEYQKPDPDTDVLYESSFIHPNHDQSCAESCFPHQERIVPRDRRDITEDDPVVHFGLIASGDQLMKDASVRDALVEKEEVLCFEMEAAGLMGRFPCLVIRGICDYSDTHKNDLWQGYAAATAAAYAKELLLLALSGRRILEEEVDVATPSELDEGDYA